ncbi:MAG TPA: hypothetical protein VIE67_13195 [Rudaea sp.]|jgi:hypothetical protein|uniref:hypothetical protein n=1 Tax=Rudaea sp. TaxID=2136325 RepID=UPI002F942F4D
MKPLFRVAVSTLLALGFAAGAQAQQKTGETHFTDAQGREVTAYSTHPAHEAFGPKPSFAQLDANHDGVISRAEAEAYPPLANDFDYVAGRGEKITARQYAKWDAR